VTDPFGTADIRRRVLDGWAASPARFREDANAEEDFARTGYRDRLVVELAQNAADAAVRARVPGRLLLRLETDALVAANTGAPLDAAGVEALSTLRASAKRDDDVAATVGRYGVGFAAVLAVTDDPGIASTTGQVSWHRALTVREVGQIASLADELERRAGAVPVLRLPWSNAGPPVEQTGGYDTTVRLPLRDAAALALAQRLLAEVDAGLLLMLPALAEVVVDDRTPDATEAAGMHPGGGPRVLRAEDLDVRQVERSGRVDPELLADRPTEERRRRTWSVRWAVPRPAGVPAVVHAPTPTDEPLDLPGLLLASFPLDPSRRHVAGGPLRDFLVERAADAYVSLVREVAAEDPGPQAVLELVPGPVAAGALDAELRQAVLTRLAAAPVLAAGLRPDEAVAVDGLADAAYAVLADVVPGLLPPAWAGRRELDRLGVQRTRLADLVDDLAMLSRPAPWWRELYQALADADRDALTGLPVPLTDGRLVRGPRSVVVGADDELAGALVDLGLRVADPQAAHPLLERLGAVPAEPRALLDDPAVRSAVESSIEADDPAQMGAAVLGLVRAAGITAGELDWLGALALPDDGGEWVAAGELLLPGGALATVVAPGALGILDAGWAQRWGAEVLTAVGVLATFALVRDEDVPVDPDRADHDLDGEDRWLDEALLDLGDVLGDEPDGRSRAGSGLPPLLPDFQAVRDLDLVDAGQWPAALRLIAGDPGLRACVCDPQRAVLADGRSVEVPSYTAWWLRSHPVLAGRLPGQLHAPGLGDALAGLLDEAPDLGLDGGFLAAIGVVTSVADVAGSPMVLPLLRAGVDPSRAAVGLGGTVLAVPSVVSRVLTGAAASYVEHDDLRVGGVACDWWVADDGTVHAATLDGLARGLAWVADRWDVRLLLAAVLAEPERVDDLVAEESWV
jgi:hypothetical protein